MIVFDIETGPAPEETLRKFLPDLPAAQHPGDFDPSSVKLGNTKDQAKIDAKYRDAAAKHAEAVAKFEEDQKTAADDHWAKFIDKAALSPITGQVVAIGYYSANNGAFVHQDITQKSEREMITTFWSQFSKNEHSHRSMVGHNIFEFDLPFLVRRSWALDIAVPPNARKGRYWSDLFVDTLDYWNLGQRMNKPAANFDALAAFFKTAGKPEGTDGSQFYDMLTTDYDRAIAYLKSDVEQPAAWIDAMGITL
ncbi:3'-5' exonuclease family protein [Blastopirellula retiformator]|uniref:Putative 3'-5' exonuclease related to the exonuclease domain of PolB n=1 Tax=Blastopirellula retiformator TaxID=2527970 RepID=A0A5C5UYF0_9BACT|nr:hypothetical protein [Blastopirellula retiformator]TWT30680.1 putative 3'-5' exonuclease related to the exonuclease domain of PolB [Blastopirellula retiformator]